MDSSRLSVSGIVDAPQHTLHSDAPRSDMVITEATSNRTIDEKNEFWRDVCGG